MSEVERPTKYCLLNLDLDTVSEMHDISGLCLQFVERGRRVLRTRLGFTLVNPTSVSSWVAPVERVGLEQQEVNSLARQIWDDHGTQLGVHCEDKLKTLGGLHLSLISAIQLLGVEATKRWMMLPDKGWQIVNYFYVEEGRELARVLKRSYSLDGLVAFERRIEAALRTTIPTNGWWEKSA